MGHLFGMGNARTDLASYHPPIPHIQLNKDIDKSTIVETTGFNKNAVFSIENIVFLDIILKNLENPYFFSG